MHQTFSWILVGLVVCGASGSRAGDGVVALQSADASCRDDSGDRYVDCGNGTVTDNVTGLVWLKQANCLAKCSGSGAPCTLDADCPGGESCDAVAVNWFTAMDFVAGLSDKPSTSAAANQDCGLSDGSTPGEWRLPSVEEWQAMAAPGVANGCSPTKITDDLGNGCWDEACALVGLCSFTGVESDYWSATTLISNPEAAWYGALASGVGLPDAKTNLNHIWPVRGGQ